jgi:hypothetical protein
MNISETISAFSQSEKVKSGLIWVSQLLEMVNGVPGHEKPGASKTLNTLLSLIGHEVRLAEKISPNEGWDRIADYMEKAQIMIQSGVPEESVVHLTKALSEATTVGHRSMSILREEGLI